MSLSRTFLPHPSHADPVSTAEGGAARLLLCGGGRRDQQGPLQHCCRARPSEERGRRTTRGEREREGEASLPAGAPAGVADPPPTEPFVRVLCGSGHAGEERGRRITANWSSSPRLPDANGHSAGGGGVNHARARAHGSVWRGE